MHKRSTLPPQAESAYRTIQAGEQKTRIQKVWNMDEPSFALLIVWTRVEALLKLIWYDQNIKAGWPEKMKFVQVTWRPLSRVAAEDSVAYNAVFRGDKSLLQVRNRIVHAGLQVAKEDASPLGWYGEWMASKLETIKPPREALLRKAAAKTTGTLSC